MENEKLYNVRLFKYINRNHNYRKYNIQCKSKSLKNKLLYYKMKIRFYCKVKNNMIKLNLINTKQNVIYYKIKLNHISNNHYYNKRRKKNY